MTPEQAPSAEQWAGAIATQQEIRGLMVLLTVLLLVALFGVFTGVALQIVLYVSTIKQGARAEGLLQASRGWVNVADRVAQAVPESLARLEHAAAESAAKPPVVVVTQQPPEKA